MNMMTLLPILTLDKSAGDDIRRNATLMALGAANPMINAVATRDLLDTAVKAERSNASLRAEVAWLRSAARKAEAPAEAETVAAAGPAGPAPVDALKTEVAGHLATIARLQAEATEHRTAIDKLTAEVAALKAATPAPQTPADAGASGAAGAGASAGAGAGDVDTAAQTDGKPV